MVCWSRAFSHFYTVVVFNNQPRTKVGIAGISDPAVTFAPWCFQRSLALTAWICTGDQPTTLTHASLSCADSFFFPQNTTKLILELLFSPLNKDIIKFHNKMQTI